MNKYVGGRQTGKTTSMIDAAAADGCDILVSSHPMAEFVAAAAEERGYPVTRCDRAINAFWWCFSIGQNNPIRVLVLRPGRMDGIRRHDREVMIDELSMFTQRMLEPYARIRGFTLSIEPQDLIRTPEVAP